MYELSIITVNLNNCKGLLKTFASVFNQTSLDFEYIVVDGASTDGSIAIIKEYSHKITRWISEADTGVYQAMNKGIRMANGKYLLFLNSGDYLINSQVLEQVFDKGRKADILCGRCNILDNGKLVYTTDPPHNITFGTLYFTGLAHQSTFIKKDLFEKVGFYREDFIYNSDIDFWYKSIILNGASTERVDNIVSNYYLDGMSSTQNKTKQFIKEHEEILSNPIFQKIIPDYIKWEEEKNELKIFYWLRGKKVLIYPIQLIFRMSRCLSSIKKNIARSSF